MAKPAITKRVTKGSALTYNELDTNFQNIVDSTINFTGDAGDTRSMDLNDATAITGERNIRVTVDETTQSIKIRNTLSDYTSDPNGFENRVDSTISFNQSTRVFSITPVGAGYNMWNKGQQYYITTVKSVTIPNTNGVHLVYFDDSTLTYSTGAEPNWRDDTPVSYVYWNSTTSIGVSTDERHGITMDASTKEYLHETASLAYAEGFQIANYTILGDGTLDAHAQLDVGNGVCYDQDLRVEITHSNTPTAYTWEQDLVGPARIPVVYHSSATGFWTIDAAGDFPVKNGTSLVTYNLNTAGSWTTPDVVSTHYVAYWIVATNLVSTPIIAIMGQREDNKLSDAIANNTWSSLDLTLFLAEEYRPLYRIIVRSATGYANTPKALFAQVDDFRLSTVAPAGSISAVNAFTTISVAGQTDITADTATDALTLVAGTGITLTTNAVADSVTISATTSGSGTVNTGVAGRLAYYPSNGTTIDDIPTGQVIWDGTNSALTATNFATGNSSGEVRTNKVGDITNVRYVTFGDTTTLIHRPVGAYSGDVTVDFYGYIQFDTAVLISSGQRAPIYFNTNDIRLGSAGNPVITTQSGSQDLILNTNVGTNSGSITISAGANNDITIAPNGNGVIVATKTVSSTVAHGVAAIDTVDTDASYANNATVDFANFSGLIIVNNTGTTGNVAVWICGGGTAVKLSDSVSNTSGTIASVGGINGYRWTNNTGATDSFSFAAIQTRAAG